MNHFTRSPVSRRDLLRAALTLGGLTAATALLEACGAAGVETATLTPTTSPEPTFTPVPTLTPRPSPTRTAGPTTGPGPSPTPPPEPSATPQPSPTDQPEPTATTEPSPTAPPEPTATEEAALSRVALVKTRDRAEGVGRALALLGVNPARGNRVLLKPNFNSAHPTPGSTHNDVLRTLVEELWEMGARSITVADRSGMGDTRGVMEQKGVFALAQELGFETLVFDDLADRDWVLTEPADTYWQKGFLIARPCLETDALVQTCCLKTHRYGGQFTLSLKNSVGMVAKYGPGDGYNYMTELHSSPDQRRMIADINAAYTPGLIVLDGVEAFVNAGPESGKKVWAEVILAGTDRVAVDAVGVALLRHFGTTPEVSSGPIFQQEQIARAVELGLGADRPEKIQLVTDDPASEDLPDPVTGLATPCKALSRARCRKGILAHSGARSTPRAPAAPPPPEGPGPPGRENGLQ
jgi:uncharacterized protein (DUF362 family)